MKRTPEIGCMYAATLGCKVCAFWVHVCGNGWVQSMRKLGAKSMDSFGCMFMPFGRMSMDRSVHVCGCWVQSMRRRLGAKYMPFGCISDTADSLPDSR